MISWAITLFIIGLIAVALGFGGVGSMALNIGWILHESTFYFVRKRQQNNPEWLPAAACKHS